MGAEPIVIVWDCGATNYRAVAIDRKGRIHAQASAHNAPVPQPEGRPEWRVWDLEGIFADLCRLTGEVMARIDASAVRALTITTWGADGAPVDREGRLTYPVISWQCPRTNDLVEEVRAMMPAAEIFRRTGYQVISFNTLLKLAWLRRHAPEIWDRTHRFVMMPGLLTHRLTGELSVDPTMAGTTMAFDASRRQWDGELLGWASVGPEIWPALVEPGRVVGSVRAAAAEKAGLPPGLPVTAAGHDTQFALYGSGARADEAVLSSGTWEILMVRTAAFEPGPDVFDAGVIVEQDAVAGFVDPQFLMMGSGVLEWVRRQFWAGEPEAGIYDKMMAEAHSAGGGPLVFLPNFVSGTGPAAKFGTPGAVVGLGLSSTRGEVYRSALEGLAMQLRAAIDCFARTLKVSPTGIALVGGGSKNPLWNQIRADVTNLPVAVTEHKEATVLGAALFALLGVGEFRSIEEARELVNVARRVVEPGGDRAKYEPAYARYQRVTEALGAGWNSRGMRT